MSKTSPNFNRAPGERAVLLVNLGTPTAPDAPALRRFLAEFLADPRVVELPRVLWFPILYGVILPFRAPRSAAAYRRVWTDEGSPLRTFSEGLTQEVATRLAGRAEVALAMRYGEPSVASQLRRLRDQGVEEVLVLPMYPQYSATTTASVFDAVVDELAGWRRWPELHLVTEYYREPAWINAVAEKIRTHREQQAEPGHLLFSFHGIPKKCVDRGDPYADQCVASAQAIAQRLGLADDAWTMSFQSRLGKAEWLRPYTDQTVRELAQRGIRYLDVVCPGFSVDCLETLEEIAIENGEYFQEAGGTSLRYIPALNADAAHAEALVTLIDRYFGSASST